ncbi:protein TolA, partial [Methylobacterium sp. WL122]
MRLPSFRSEPGFWVSAGTHVGLLVFALFSVAAPALPEAQEGVPVEVITENQFSELTKGERNAEKPLSDAKPRADKKAEKFEEKEPENAKVDSPTAPTRTSDMKLANADEMPLRVNEPDPSAEAAKAAKMAKEKAEAEKADAAKAEAKAEAAKAAAAEKAA